MKSGVEYRDLENIRADDAIDGLNRFELEPVVGGRELRLFCDGRANFRG